MKNPKPNVMPSAAPANSVGMPAGMALPATLVAIWGLDALTGFPFQADLQRVYAGATTSSGDGGGSSCSGSSCGGGGDGGGCGGCGGGD